VYVGRGPGVKSGSHKGTEGKGGVHEKFCKAGEALIEDETLMGTAASKGRWREAQRKQSVTLMDTVRFRSCSEAWNSWIQVGGWRAGEGIYVSFVWIVEH
jgi:hypothetical protein